MSADSKSDIQLEIGHVLFMDVVGYSKLLINDQREIQQRLSEIVRNTEQFRAAEAVGKLIRLPVGIYLAQHDNENAQKAFEKAQPSFEASVKEAPLSANRTPILAGSMRLWAGKMTPFPRDNARLNSNPNRKTLSMARS
jgi:hypothetical protein